MLLHSWDTATPEGTRRWLAKRPWISSHFHIRLHPRMTRRLSDEEFEAMYKERMTGRMTENDVNNDFSRLARHITGTSIGLVLGGGGAKGAAHLGLVQAMVEAGVPIDKVGRTHTFIFKNIFIIQRSCKVYYGINVLQGGWH